MTQPTAIGDREFAQVCEVALRCAGISLGPGKRALVESRLRRRVIACGLADYGEYLSLIARQESAAELQTAIDLLTTNETSFFREPRHFERLRQQIGDRSAGEAAFRAWSAACSSGEEPYTIAMVLADVMGPRPWEVVASDLSMRMLQSARNGHYPMERARGIPQALLYKYCLSGRGAQEGTFLINPAIRERIQFRHWNLLHPASSVGGLFDAIFLRNVLIYFDTDTRRRVVRNLLPALKSDGLLYIGHSDSLRGLLDEIELVTTAVYRKVAR